MPKTVLVVENDPDTLDVMREALIYLGMSVICRTGTPGIAELKTLGPALILLDHWLNDELGADFCHLVKTDPQTAHIPVIMVSAVTTIGAVADHAMADGLLNKPFDINRLEELVRHYAA